METSKQLISAKVPRVLLPDSYKGASDWEGLSSCVIEVAEEKVVSVNPANESTHLLDFDFNNSILLPGFLDSHTHLDKAHSWKTPTSAATPLKSKFLSLRNTERSRNVSIG